MFGLVDVNNFYCSCERVFNPALDNKPVVVLSNNDGCAIARSEEAKLLGIEMGAPAHMIQELIDKHEVEVFSSNYTLYGDMSDRVMKTLASFVYRMEIYSIDEAFLDMSAMPYTDLFEMGISIKHTIKKHLGLPVCVGVAKTKTLAKMANRFAKKQHREIGVHWANSQDRINEMLAFTEVGDISGIGKQYAGFLLQHGFKTGLEVANTPERWIKKHLTVVGQRLWNELRGVPSFAWEYEPKPKKNICSSRSFGSLLTDKKIIREAVCNYTAVCGAKLREQKSCAAEISVFVETNPHRTEEPYYYHSIPIDMEVATNNTSELIKYATRGFDIIFQEGYRYMKAGVIVSKLVPEDTVQGGLFTAKASPKHKAVM